MLIREATQVVKKEQREGQVVNGGKNGKVKSVGQLVSGVLTQRQPDNRAAGRGSR